MHLSRVLLSATSPRRHQLASEKCVPSTLRRTYSAARHMCASSLDCCGGDDCSLPCQMIVIVLWKRRMMIMMMVVVASEPGMTCGVAK